MSTSPPALSRRAFLRTATGAGTAAGVAGASGAAAARQGATQTVEMTDELVFEPSEISIEPGDTVVWENVGTIPHSVTAYAESVPADADYFASGGFDSEQAARDAYPSKGQVEGGETYEHTFEAEGVYEYFCIPHEGAGMIGSVTVGAAGGSPTGSGGVVPQVPESARFIALWTIVGMLSVIGLSYFFLKYGGDYGFDDEE